ncbi:hypothetical protein HK103_003975 [Boothiomyces macroporosus]|uniref:Uncharacterized protein n=1 Tax=Boothiomyces macroporosus TaxID=261099 RepID=A0AAD5UHA8_9FUNG|nr:hypothetical protein HK103_003975 [Boothiomyces macroporosus]
MTECTKGKINGFVEYAEMANENGAYNLTKSILQCFEAQRNMEIEERANTMVYPVLNTKWNRKVGEDTLLKIEIPEIKLKRITTPKRPKPLLKRKSPEKELSLAVMAEFYPKELVTEDVELLEQARRIEQQRQEKRERIAEKVRLQKEKAKQIKIKLEKRKALQTNRAIEQAQLAQQEEQKKELEVQERRLKRLDLQKGRKGSRSNMGLSRKRKNSKKSVDSESKSQLDISDFDNPSVDSVAVFENGLEENQFNSSQELASDTPAGTNEQNKSEQLQPSDGNIEGSAADNLSQDPSASTQLQNIDSSTAKPTPESAEMINNSQNSQLPDLPEKESAATQDFEGTVSRVEYTDEPITDLSNDPESVLKLDSHNHPPTGEGASTLDDEKKQILEAVENMTPRQSVRTSVFSKNGQRYNENDHYYRRKSVDSMRRQSINEEAILQANYRGYDESGPRTVDTNSPFGYGKSRRHRFSIASRGEISHSSSQREIANQTRRSVGSDNSYYMDDDGVLILKDQVTLDMEEIKYQSEAESEVANLRDIVKKSKTKGNEMARDETDTNSSHQKKGYDKEYVLEKDLNVERSKLKFGIEGYKKKSLQPFVTRIPIKRSNVKYVPPINDAVHKFIGRPVFPSQNQFLYETTYFKVDFDALKEESEEEEDFDTPYIPPSDSLEFSPEDSLATDK